MTRSTLAAALICALPLSSALVAQNKQITVPKKYENGGTSRTLVPFSEQPLRFQQSFSAAIMTEQIKLPCRLRGMSFKTKAAGDTGVQIDLQVAISNFSGGPLNGFFSRNMQSNATVVIPRRTFNLPPSTGGFDLALPFTQDWIWDGKSAVVIDVQMFGNGNQGRQFFYWWDWIGADASAGVTSQYALGTNATVANVTLLNQGYMLRFDYQDGVAINYGTGCKGLGGFTPKASTTSLPTVGNPNFRINVTEARPSTVGILMWGASDSQWGPITLPFALINIGIPNCTLLAEPLDLVAATITGGSPGTGNGSLAFPIPPSGLLKGYNLYMQWAVIDDSNNAALDLVFSDALRVVIG